MPETTLSRLDAVKRFLQLKFSKEKDLQKIVELAAAICEAPVAMITIMDDETQHVKFNVGVDLTEVPFNDTFCQHTIIQQDMLVIGDASADERVRESKWVTNHPHVRFYAGSPLSTHDNHNIGTLCVFDSAPKILSGTQQKMLSRLARQVTLLLEFDASLQLMKEQHMASQLEENKLRSFFESSTSCHLLLDTDLLVISYNSTILNVLAEMYGAKIREGMGISEYVVPSFLEEFTDNCRRALRGEVVSVESVVPSNTGDIPWLHTYEPALDWQGVICGVSYVATDITQVILHEKTVASQGESLRQIDLIVSAGLREPLELIKDTMSALKREGYPDDVPEFNLLELTCDELCDKEALILSKDSTLPGHNN